MEGAIAALEGNAEDALIVTVPPDLRDLARFCTALRGCRRLRRLALRGLRTRPTAVQDIMAALESNRTLEVLDLGFNELGDAGIKAVLVALTMGDVQGAGGAATGLHTLLLDSNGLDENAAGVLALLGLEHGLRKVSLRGNRLGDRCALLLAGALPGKSALEEIDLRDNDIGTDGAEQLVAMIDRGRGSLRSIHLQGNARMDSAKLLEVEAKVNQLPRSPSPRKSPRKTVTEEKSDGAILTPNEAGRVLNELCSRVQDALNSACSQAQAQERQMQLHASVLGEITRDVEDGLADLARTQEKRSDSDAGPGVREHSFSHTFEKAREESMRRSVHKTLQLAAEEVSAAAREMRKMHSQLNFEQSQVAVRVNALQQYLSFRNSISWQKLSPGTIRSHEQRLHALESDLISRQEAVDNLHRELRAKADDLDAREQRLNTMMNMHTSAVKLDAERKAAAEHHRVLQEEKQRVHNSEEAIKAQQDRLLEKSAEMQQLQQRLLQTEEALRNKTLELAELESELRGNAHKLAAAEQLLRTKIDQAADEQAQARAKSLSAQAMMEELEEMLVTLEGKELSVTGAARRHARTLQFEAAARLEGVHTVAGPNEAAVGAIRPVTPLHNHREGRGGSGSGLDESDGFRETAAQMNMREGAILDKELALSAQRAELEATQRDLEASRFELADRHKKTSALRAELDALFADVRAREYDVRVRMNEVELGARTVEHVLALLESTAASHQHMPPAPTLLDVGDRAAREREKRGGAKTRSLSLSPRKMLPSSPAAASRGGWGGGGARGQVEEASSDGAAWAQRAGYIKRVFENVVAALKTKEDEQRKRDAEWDQAMNSLNVQLAQRDEEIRQLRHYEGERCDAEQKEREKGWERERERHRERELEWERDRANVDAARLEAERRERDMQLEHARRESELLRRISSVEGEMAKLAAQLESERCELENKQRDLEKARVASREEMAVRETALRSLLEDQKGELLHQSQSLQQVNADLAQNWTSVRSKQQELNALEDALAAGKIELARDLQSLRHQQQAIEEREQALKEREDRFGKQETVMTDLHARNGQLSAKEERQMSEVRSREQLLQAKVEALDSYQDMLPKRSTTLQSLQQRTPTAPSAASALSPALETASTLSATLGSSLDGGHQIAPAEVEAEWHRLALTQQGIEQHKERLRLREERLNVRIQEHERQVEEWTKSGEAHQRQVCKELDEREAQVVLREARVAVREKAVAEHEAQVQEMKRGMDMKMKHMESFDAMATFREQELRRREVELDGKEANVREAETVIAYLETELRNTEDDMARIQQEVMTLVKSLNERQGMEARERQRERDLERHQDRDRLLTLDHAEMQARERELGIAAREQAVEVREREQVRKEKELQEVQLLAERYASALEIKKREVAMSQLELQMKLTEMGIVQ